MTNAEMKSYLMKFGGSLNNQILGMFIELKEELANQKCSCKDTKDMKVSKPKGKK